MTDKPGSTWDPALLSSPEHLGFPAYFHWRALKWSRYFLTQRSFSSGSGCFHRCLNAQRSACFARSGGNATARSSPSAAPNTRDRCPFLHRTFRASVEHLRPRWICRSPGAEAAGAAAPRAKARPRPPCTGRERPQPQGTAGPQRSPRALPASPSLPFPFPFLFSSPPQLPSFPSLPFPSLFPLPCPPRPPSPGPAPPPRVPPARPSPGTSWRWFPMLSRGSPPRSSAAIAVYPESSLGRRRGGGRRRAEEEPERGRAEGSVLSSGARTDRGAMAPCPREGTALAA